MNVFFLNKSFWINFGVLILFSIITVFLIFKWLDSYTNHNEYITLNDFTGLSLEQTISILEDKKLNYSIIDTNSFRDDLPNKSIVSQDPLPLKKVKEGRIVYLYISTNKAPLIEVPFLKGKDTHSYEAGIMKLKNAKFKIGEVYFKPSDSEGDILSVMIDSVELNEGQMAPEGSYIQLVVGGGLGGAKKPTPCLIGLSKEEAEFKLGSLDLNIGFTNYSSKKISDTTTAIIYKQLPNEGDAIRIGEGVDLFFIQELPLSINKCDTNTLVE